MRPLWRNVGLTLALLVVFALALPLGYRALGRRAAARAAADLAAEVGPLALARCSRPDVPAAENAAHWIQAGATAVVLEPSERELLLQVNHRPLREWSAEQRENAAGIVDRNAPALILLHKATNLERSSFDLDYSQGLSMPIPNLQAVLNGGRLLLAELETTLVRGDVDGAILSQRAIRALARACQLESPAVFQFIGLALERLAWQGLQDLMLAAETRGKDLAEFRRPLLDTSLDEQLRRSVACEASVSLTASASDLARELDVSAWIRLLIPYLKDRADARDMVYSRRAMTFYSDHSAAEILGGTEGAQALLSRPAAGALDLPAYYGGWIPSAIHRFKAGESLRQLGTLALELRQAAFASGHYPTDLEEHPVAGANPYTGGPIGYHLERDGSAWLEVPRASALWRSNNPSRPSSEDNIPSFAWRLPPIPPTR